MELNDSIQQIAKRYLETKDHILTEEATKTSLIMPFIQALGYDVCNPVEVVPEHNAEITGRGGDKVDYAIKKNNEIIILIECKWHGLQLDINKESQLMRYFQALSPKKIIAILTNGVQYRFYTDLDDKNKMDLKPFLQFDITSINETILKELQRYTKATFDIENIMPAAEELKYTGAIKKYLSDSLSEPHDDFVRALATQVYEGKFTEKMREKFKEIVKKAFNQFVSDRVSDRLSSALQEERASVSVKETEPESLDETSGRDERIVTTQDEIDGYNIIKAILRQVVDVKRVAMRDTANYCGVLLDNNRRRPICRLFFNNPEKLSIVLFDADKKETEHSLTDVDGIYGLADEIVKNVAAIDRKNIRKAENSDEENGEGEKTTGVL